MKVLVAGATGVLGRRLVPMLVERGHDVHGTTTRQDKLAQIASAGATPLLLDGLHAEAVRHAVREVGPEAIIHEMTALKGRPDFKHFDRWFAATNELRTMGTQNLLDAALDAGTTRRLIVQSYTGWTGDDSRTGLLTEDEPLDPDPLPQQRATLEAVERMERTVLDAPIDGIVLRYANLYSADGMEHSVQLLRKRQLPLVGGGTGVWSWVHARDAASATVAALESGKSGIYNVADDHPAPVREWLPYLAELIGAPKPMRVPARLARLIAGDVAVRMMTRSRGVSNARIKRDLGWRPAFSSWREGFKEIAQQRATEELAHALS